MKGRRTVAYLLVLLLLGGYFYYFEVIKKQEKEEAEQQARRVFRLQADQVRFLEVTQKDKGVVRLEKREGTWAIVEPMQSEADSDAVEGFVSTLELLETQREVGSAEGPEALKPFGLVEPLLKVRFQEGERWHELVLGDKNPAGDGYYAAISEKNGVFLVAAGNWGTLDKGFDDLRRRTLFTFEPEEVRELQVLWKDGAPITIVRKEDGGGWEAPGQPDLVVKQSKVESLIDQIQWLRARSFVRNDIQELDKEGLQPAHVAVVMQLDEGKQAEFRLAEPSEEKKDVVAALSSELPGVVQVESRILNVLPKSMKDLEDRSLLTFVADEVQEVSWQVGEEAGGHVVRQDERKWAWKGEGGRSETIDEPWHVDSLLWGLQDTEFETKVDPDASGQGVEVKPYGRLELQGAEKRSSIAWEKPGEDPSKNVRVVMESNGSSRAVEARPDTIHKIEGKIRDITAKGKQQP